MFLSVLSKMDKKKKVIWPSKIWPEYDICNTYNIQEEWYVYYSELSRYASDCTVCTNVILTIYKYQGQNLRRQPSLT